MKKKILIYGDSNLNLVDGSTIWIANLAVLLAQDERNLVDILVKVPIENDILVQAFSRYPNIRLLDAHSYISKYDTVDYANICPILKRIDSLRDYSCMIVRGKAVVKRLLSTSLKEKIIPYITDFCHDETKISDSEKSELLSIYSSVSNMFVQTEAMKEYLMKVLGIDGEKFHVLPPIVFPQDSIQKEPKTIVYAGKLANDWYILELIEIMKQLYVKDPEIKLYFVGNKFNRDLVHKKEEILHQLKTMPNVCYIEQLSKEKTSELVQKCEMGFAFRNASVDHDGSLEISIKFLEYCTFQTAPIVRRTKMYQDILGKRYPLYVEGVEDAVDKIIHYFQEDHSKVMNQVSKNMKQYDSHFIYESVKKAIDCYPSKRVRFLLTGHDLKFFRPLLPYFEHDYEVTIQEYDDYRLMNKREAKKLLLGQDIIWCEWMLFNAAWYSKHVYPHQKLFIRAHRFEIEKNYGFLIDLANVEKIITVSYYYYEAFIEKFRIPRSKITVVNNFVETEKYTCDKNTDYQYHLAMIGSVPSLKGFDKAVELLHRLNQVDERFCLYVAGKRPEEWPNAWNIPHERAYFLKVYDKIKEYGLTDRVIFTGWVDNKEFLKDIGYVLSMSSIESFHLAPLEGMASSSIALALKWPGVEYIYPKENCYDSLEDMVDVIVKYSRDLKLLQKDGMIGKSFVCEQYDISNIYENLKKVVGYEKRDF